MQIAKDVSLRTKKQGDNNVDPRYVEKIKVLSLKRTDFKGDAEMSNSRIELVMLLKQLCRVSANYDYLNNNLPNAFFRDFISQFY